MEREENFVRGTVRAGRLLVLIFSRIRGERDSERDTSVIAAQLPKGSAYYGCRRLSCIEMWVLIVGHKSVLSKQVWDEVSISVERILSIAIRSADVALEETEEQTLEDIPRVCRFELGETVGDVENVQRVIKGRLHMM